MMRSLRLFAIGALALSLGFGLQLLAADQEPPAGYTSLFNGKDLKGWKVPEGDNGHWKVKNGVIDYDARSEAKKDKDLWTEKSYADFDLHVEWRLKTDEPGFMNPNVFEILPSGLHKKDENGKDIKHTIEDVDSGVYLRGNSKSQVNIWMWPIGSGEVYGYRMDAKMPPEVRAGVTPKKKMDKPRGQWNVFDITMKGDHLTVKLNGEQVVDSQLPGIPKEGPIGLQHHGQWDEKAKTWKGPPSMVQFRNIWVKELK